MTEETREADGDPATHCCLHGEDHPCCIPDHSIAPLFLVDRLRAALATAEKRIAELFDGDDIAELAQRIAELEAQLETARAVCCLDGFIDKDDDYCDKHGHRTAPPMEEK